MPRPLSDDLLNFLWDFLFSKKLFFPLSKARASEHCRTQENPPPTAPLPQRWYHLSLQRGRVLSDRVQGCSNLLPIQTVNSIRKSRPSPTSPSLPTSPAHPFSSTIIKLLMVHGCDFCVVETLVRGTEAPQVGSSLRDRFLGICVSTLCSFITIHPC